MEIVSIKGKLFSTFLVTPVKERRCLGQWDYRASLLYLLSFYSVRNVINKRHKEGQTSRQFRKH